MPTQAAIQRSAECPFCHGRGYIGLKSRETSVPRTQEPPAAKLVLAFVLGFLMLSPALLGLYWETLLSYW